MTQRLSVTPREKIGSGTFRGRSNGSLELGTKYNIIGSSIPLVWGQKRFDLPNVFSEAEPFSEPSKRKLLYCAGLGELEDIPKDEVYLDGVKLQDLNPEVFEVLLGDGTKQAIAGMAYQTVNTQRLGTEMPIDESAVQNFTKTGNPHDWVTLSTDTQVDSVDIVFDFLDGIYFKSSGYIQGTLPGKAWVEYQYRETGTNTWSSTTRVKFDEREESELTKLQRAYNRGEIARFTALPRGNDQRLKKSLNIQFSKKAKYDIRVRRWYDPAHYTKGDTFIYTSNPTLPSNVFQLAENVREPLERDLAFVGIKISSNKIEQDTPNCSAFVKGRKTLSNQSYTNDTGFSRNPLWALWDALTIDRDLGGAGVPEENLLAWGAQNKSVADYCDESVDDGDGGTETRHQFDFVLQEKKDVKEFVRHVETLYGMRHSEVQGGIRFDIMKDKADKNEQLVIGRGNIGYNSNRSSLSVSTRKGQNIKKKTVAFFDNQNEGYNRAKKEFSRDISSAETTTTKIIDDFEDGNRIEYTEGGIKSSNDVFWGVQTAKVKEGQWALQAFTDPIGSDEEETLISSSLNNKPERGDKIEGWISGSLKKEADDNYKASTRPGVYFAVQSDDDRYRFFVQLTNDKQDLPDTEKDQFIKLQRIENGSVQKENKSGTFRTSESDRYQEEDLWFKYIIEWGQEVITATLEDYYGNELAEAEIADKAWDSGDFGFGIGTDSLLIDDFEDGDLSEYTEGPNGGDANVSWTNQTGTVKEGSNALESDVSATEDVDEILLGDGLKTTMERGDKVSGWIRQEEGDDNIAVSEAISVTFCVQSDTTDRYKAEVKTLNSTDIGIKEIENGSINTSSTNSDSTARGGEWLFLEIDFDTESNDEITATVKDSNKNDIVSATISSTKYDSGDFGFETEAKQDLDSSIDITHYWDDWGAKSQVEGYWDIAKYTRKSNERGLVPSGQREINLNGVSRPTEVKRRAKEITQREQNEYLEITADTTLEPIRLTVGDNLWLAHEAIGTGWGESGTIVDSEVDGDPYAYLDDKKSVDSNTTYELVYLDQSDNVQHETVSFSEKQKTNIIQLPSNANQPQAKTTYAWGPEGSNGGRVRLEEKQERGDNTTRLKMRVQDTSARSDAEGVSVTASELEKEFDKMGSANAVDNLKVDETSYVEEGGQSSSDSSGDSDPKDQVVPEITVSWDEPDDQPKIEGYKIYVNEVYDQDTSTDQYDLRSFRRSGLTEKLSDGLPITRLIGVKVTTVLRNGVETSLSNAPTQTVQLTAKRDVRPSQPNNLTASSTKKGIELTWDAPSGDLVRDYDVRLGRSWENGRKLATNVKDTKYTYTEELTSAEYSFMVRTNSLKGTGSKNISEVTFKPSSVGTVNEIYSTDEQDDGWPGTKTNCQVVTRNSEKVVVPDHNAGGSYVSNFTYQTGDITLSKDWDPTVNIVTGVQIPSRNGPRWDNWATSSDTWNDVNDTQPFTWDTLLFHGGATIEYRTQTDADTSYGSWKEFTGPFDNVTFKQIQFKITVQVLAEDDELRLKQFHPLITTREKTLDKSTDSSLGSFTIGTNNTTVDYDTYTDDQGEKSDFYESPDVVRAVNLTDGSAVIEVNNQSASSADFKDAGSNGTDADIEIIGY